MQHARVVTAQIHYRYPAMGLASPTAWLQFTMNVAPDATEEAMREQARERGAREAAKQAGVQPWAITLTDVEVLF